MPQAAEFLLGEFPRMLDERHRLTLPSELAERSLQFSTSMRSASSPRSVSVA
jgi:hypothetical protein